MLNLTPEYREFPFPHLIYKDFIRDEERLDYLSNNEELSSVMASREDLGDLERIEIGRFMKGKYSYDLRKANPFSNDFKSKVGQILRWIENCGTLRSQVKKHFVPHFEREYEGFDEDFKQMMVSYGAYNATEKPLNLIGWHLDNGKKLCSGFIYLREDGDDADDGHLFLSDGYRSEKVEYENNLMVIWPNLPNAWHMAGVRQPTKHLRRIINIVYESDKTYHDYRTERSSEVVNDKELYSHKQFGFKEVNKL